jgi:hypothetical protein
MPVQLGASTSVCRTAGVLPRGPERSEGLVGSNDRVLQRAVTGRESPAVVAARPAKSIQ